MSALTALSWYLGRSVSALTALRPSTLVSRKDVSIPKHDAPVPSVTSLCGPCHMDISPSPSAGGSVSLDETMLTCDSRKSPDVEHIDYGDASAVASVERKACNHHHISDHMEIASGYIM